MLKMMNPMGSMPVSIEIRGWPLWLFLSVSPGYWGQGGQGGQGDDHWGKKGGGKTKVPFAPNGSQTEEKKQIESYLAFLKTILSHFLLIFYISELKCNISIVDVLDKKPWEQRREREGRNTKLRTRREKWWGRPSERRLVQSPLTPPGLCILYMLPRKPSYQIWFYFTISNFLKIPKFPPKIVPSEEYIAVTCYSPTKPSLSSNYLKFSNNIRLEVAPSANFQLSANYGGFK